MRRRLFPLLLAPLACAPATQKSATPAAAEQSAPSPEATARPAAAPKGMLAAICKETSYRAPKLDGLTAHVVADGYHFLEGPVWVASAQTLLFSDMQPGSGAEGVQPSHVRRWSSSGKGTYLENAGSNGLAIDERGALYACTHDTQSVSLFDGSELGSDNARHKSSLVSLTQGKHFNSPNDLTLRSDGTLYFTDPNWQRGQRPSETGITGVYRARAGQEATLVDGTLRNPNGIAQSPDEAFLYVGAGDDQVRRYALAADGSTGPAEPFARVPGPDGMSIDCAGNVYVTAHGAGKVFVLSPEGKELGTIAIAPSLTNVAFGGADGRTLFATTAKALYAVDMDIAGSPY